MVSSSQLTGSEYQPAGRLSDAGGSPSHMDIPIHRATLLSGELHARLDPVAYPQLGSKYAGTVDGVTYPSAPVALAADALDASTPALFTPAGAVVPRWTGVPVQTSDTFGVQDGWGLSIAGHHSYKIAVEIANGASAPTQFAFDTVNAPVENLTTGLASIGGGKEVNAIYVIRATDAVLPANALLIQRFAAAYVPPAGPHWSVTPTLNTAKDTVVTGVAVITATGTTHFGITYNTGTSDPHYFAYSSVNGPGTYDQGGVVNVTGQAGTITELWAGPTSNRTDATLVQTFT